MIHRTKHTTFEEFERLQQQPENADRLLELLNGEIIEKVPTEEHGIIVLNIASPMRAFVRLHKLGRVTTEGLHRLPDDDQNAVLPDVSYRSNPASPVVRKGAIPTMPDLAVEIQSPSQSDDYMAEKARYYLANGTQEVWLVYPEKRTVEVCRLDQTNTFTENDILNSDDILPGFNLPVRDVFILE